MNILRNRALLAVVMSFSLLVSSLLSLTSQAALVTTQAAVTQQVETYDRQQLLQAINQEEVRDKLVSMGVDPLQVEERIQTLTGAELAQLNAEIEQLPAGQGVVGVLLTLFIVFVITDMLCATDLFGFVNCINR